MRLLGWPPAMASSVHSRVAGLDILRAGSFDERRKAARGKERDAAPPPAHRGHPRHPREGLMDAEADWAAGKGMQKWLSVQNAEEN